MALDQIAGRLRALDMFRNLDNAQLQRLAQSAERLVFRDGQAIIEAGKPSDGAIVLIGGRARTEGDTARQLEAQTIEPGSMLGETAMLSEHTFTLTVVADGDVRAVKLMRDTLRQHMEEDPSLADHFHSRLAERLQRMAVELRMIDERLAAASQLVAPKLTA